MEVFKCYTCYFPWSLSSRGVYSLRYKRIDPSGEGGSVLAPHWAEDLFGPRLSAVTPPEAFAWCTQDSRAQLGKLRMLMVALPSAWWNSP